MKKSIALLLALVMMFCLILAGCGEANEAPADNAPADNADIAEPAETADEGSASGEVTNISFASGGTSGTYYGFTGIVAQVLNQELADIMNITVESTGASKANVQLVDAGECNMAIVQNDVMYYAYSATDMFEGESAVESFSAVCSCYPEYVQIIAKPDITSIADLKGKNVSVGDAGSGCEFNARQILAAYDISFDDIAVTNQSFADSADSLKNGTIDAAFVVAGYPTTAVTELATTYEFNILPIDEEHAAALQSDYSFYTYGSIPADTYSCVSEDVQI
ncbi:MAG: TAXI family TRAP transporter solute-binding subunit, partial [Oscillospiraceae bacterium]|nr:TAXI family TRAP transporter solute-binding subunit [Oscillospiraceae bacterium]